MEGRGLRRVYKILATRFIKESKKEEPDIDSMIKLATTMAQIAHIKDLLAKSTDREDRIARLERIAMASRSAIDIPT